MAGRFEKEKKKTLTGRNRFDKVSFCRKRAVDEKAGL